MSIRGHVLVYCERTCVLVESDQERILVAIGDWVLLSDISVTLSMLSLDATGAGVSLFFFGDRVLADVVPLSPMASSLQWISAHYPCPDGIIHIVDRSLAPVVRSYDPKDLLKPILTGLLTRITQPVWKLCLHRVGIPRVRIQIFLENLVLRTTAEQFGIMERFPGGRNALLRQMRHLSMPRVSALVDRRRMELCYVWHNYGGRSVEDVLQALNVCQPRRFLARYARWIARYEDVKLLGPVTGYHGSLMAAQTSYLPSFRGLRLKLPREDAAKNRSAHGADPDPEFRKPEDWDRYFSRYRTAPDQLNDAFVGESAASRPEGKVDPAFWEMKSTGVQMTIEAEKLWSFSGLDDCRDLLFVA